MRHNATRATRSMLARFPGFRRSKAAELAEASGTAAPKGDRRGSALILVLGALALISIFAAVYVTVGQGDRRTSTALATNRRVSEFPLIFADHIADVIGADRLAVEVRAEFGVEGEGGPVGGTFGGGGGGGTNQGLAKAQLRLRRENTDFPYTDYSVRSVPGLINSTTPPRELLKFNPPGTHYDPATNLGIWAPAGSDVGQQLVELARDTRSASDPWLASTEATYLGGPALTDRLYSGARAANAVDQAQLFYLDRRDWAHITNISPDGMYVNLYNLRPWINSVNNARGGYDARPGWDTYPDPSTNQPRSPMSAGLSLIQLSGDADDPLRAMDVEAEGFWVPGAAAPAMWNAGTFGPPENVPAVWSSNQRYMLLPLNQPFIFYDRSGVIADWSSPDYPAYQYADADGDGLADSRWFEMTDSSDSGFNNWIYRNLAAVDGYRLFAAARVVDLSALVNINTATDGLIPPTDQAWIGSTPADIDMRRVLAMIDTARNNADWKVPLSKRLSYTSIKRDGRPAWAGGAQTDLYSDYSNYQININPGTGLYTDTTGLLIGRYAADALTLAILGEGTLSEQTAGGGRNGTLLEGSSFYDVNQAPGGADDAMAALRRLFFYQRIGSQDPTDPVSAGVAGLGAGYFGISDMGELLAFWGINDDQVYSRLEQTVGNRYDNGAGTNVAGSTLRQSPIYDGRPIELDRQRHDSLYNDFDRNAAPQPTGQVDPDSIALLQASVRRMVTTISGATALLSSRLDTGEVTSLSSGEVPELTHEFLDGIAGGGTSNAEVLGLYLDALADAARAKDTWVVTGDEIQLNEYSTLFYGAAGPEVAVRLSAHLAANLIDMYDDDDEPTAFSLLVTEDTALKAEFEQLIMGGTGNPASTSFPWDPANIINLNDFEGQKYTGLDNQATSEAYTVYGVEAYPVLTEVSAMVVLTDASTNAGGDNDASGGGGPWVPIGGPPPPEITIEVDNWDGDSDGNSYGPDGAWAGNPDLAYIGFSFQLTNPFDQDISLGSPDKGHDVALDDDEYLYYLEFNGRYFKVGNWDETDYNNIVLGAGESKTFYIIANPTLQDIADKWTDLVDGYVAGAMVDAAEVQAWLDSQYTNTVGAGTVLPGRVLKFNPMNGRASPPSGFENMLVAGGQSQALLNRPATNTTVRLWRRMDVQGATGFNTPQHDLLVDRLSETGTGGLVGTSQTLDPVPSRIDEDEVKDTVAGNESTAGGNLGPNDNSGWTFAFYGSIRRGDHPGSSLSHNGVLPGWMIDAGAKTTISDTVPFANSLAPNGTEMNPPRLKDAHFAGFTRRYAHKRFSDFLDLQSPSRPIVATIAHHPYLKSSITGSDVAGLFTTKTVSPLDDDTYYEPATTPGAVALYPELGPGEREAVEQNVNVQYPGGGSSFMIDTPLVRATDLLLVPALGWFEKPDPTNPLLFDDTQWVTFGQALGYAMHMTPTGTGDPVLRHLVREVNSQRRYALDGLNLRVDDFVAFYNKNMDPDRYYEPDAGDARVGVGVPMAIDLLSRFRGLGPADSAEALTTKVPGLLNINTVSPNVMRAAPLLTPSLELDSQGKAEWWGSNTDMGAFGTGLPDAVADAATFTAPDVAAQLVAYRDRLAGEYRVWSYDYDTMPGSLTPGGAEPFGYRLLKNDGTVRNIPDAATVVLNNYSGAQNDFEMGRTFLTGIEAMRERPGFTSTGEAAAAVISPAYFENVLGDASLMQYDAVSQNQPSYIGLDQDGSGIPVNTGVVGSGSGVVTLETQLYGGAGDDIPNDYEERLAVLSGLLNTTTTRSDTYAVWFVVHGYREGDVKNLRDDDPLVPSYARRFMMVVDRSNVTAQGQKPRVLLFQEVPY